MSELALKLIKEAKEKRLTRLDLGNCGLTELPDELFELVWLEELSLGEEWTSWEKGEYKSFKTDNNGFRNKLSQLPQEFSLLNNLRKLWINGDGRLEYKVSEISMISGLKKLEQLELVWTKVTDLRSLSELTELKYLRVTGKLVNDLIGLSNLQNLQNLILYSRVSDITALANLINLQILKISGKVNTDIEPLSSLINLIELEIIGIYVTDLFPLRKLQKLQKLHINRKAFDNIIGLEYLEELTSLDISRSTVSDLSPISNLTNLKQLDCSSTNVSDLLPISNLAKLEKLNCNSTKITDLSPISTLNNLQQFSCSYTDIKDLTPLTSLTKLEKLNCNSTKIADLSPISTLNNLQQFDFSSTKVSDLSPLAHLINLKQLNCSSTNITDLEPILFMLKNGIKVKWESWAFQNTISVKECPLTNPPLEIVEKGNKAILNYWKQKEKQGGTVELYEAKLIIVGEGATGKTTLFEKLKDNNHPIGNTPETHGINIHEGLPFQHTHIGDNTFHANLWDFGGQELQYMTHQFFLTPRALYVLMMDARRESPNLAYWFKIISLLGRDREDSTEKVRLLLVFNKRGNSTGIPPQYQDQLKYYKDSLDVQYLEVDFAENDYRFENLQNCIKQSLVTLPIVKSQLPRLWKVVREDLRDEAKTESYITTKRFSDICSKHGITEEADQWLLSGYLHQLGSLLHFQNDKGLRRLVILSPQWAVDGVYTFLSDESIARNNGRFTEEAFIALLATKGYNRDDADVILQLMTKNNFDICYEATEGNYVAAQLLPDNAPQYKWFPKEVLQFRYQYPIMPKGLMSRLIVRLSDNIERDKDSNEQIVWKKGVVLHIKLKEGECRVRLREDDAESKAGLRQILIDVMGEQDARKYALRKVRDTVDDLHKKWFRSIKADEMVPCCCSECKISDNPQLYKLENLLKRRLKRPDTSCDVSGEDLMIQQLLEGVYDKNEIRDMGLI